MTEQPGRYQPQCPYVITGIWENVRTPYIYPKDAEDALKWLKWAERSEPEIDPAIEIKDKFFTKLAEFNDAAPQTQAQSLD